MNELRIFDHTTAGKAPTVSSVVSQYLDVMDARTRSGQIQPECRDRARRYCTKFAEEFDGPIRGCRRTDLEAFLAAHPTWKSPHTIHDAVNAVLGCFNWAEEARLIRRCPYRRPKGLPACEPRAPISAEEVKTILAHARVSGYSKTRVRFRIAVWFLWQTGARTIEMYRLDWSQYDAERGCFELASKSTRKTGAKRLIVLTSRAWRLVRFLWRWAGRPTKGCVFPNGRGRRWNRQQFGRRFKERARGAGVSEKMTAYCLRHGFCCERLEAGVGERQLADVLGHSSTRYVAWYGRGVKSRVDYLRAAAEMRK